jgi:hypothetical protein
MTLAPASGVLSVTSANVELDESQGAAQLKEFLLLLTGKSENPLPSKMSRANCCIQYLTACKQYHIWRKKIY